MESFFACLDGENVRESGEQVLRLSMMLCWKKKRKFEEDKMKCYVPFLKVREG